MKVRELIRLLEGQDPDLDVMAGALREVPHMGYLGKPPQPEVYVPPGSMTILDAENVFPVRMVMTYRNMLVDNYPEFLGLGFDVSDADVPVDRSDEPPDSEPPDFVN